MQRLLSALLVLGPGVLLQVPRQPVVLPPAGLRVVVLERDEQDAAAWRAIRDLGANVVAISRGPSGEIDEIAGGAGLNYLALLTIEEIQVLARDAPLVAEVGAQRNLAGFYYWDAAVLEGFTTPGNQERAYATLKALFPDKLVLYPTRLDPIVWSPGFLDAYFRPEFTDLVTPYYYPVGTTIIGEAQERDATWPTRLNELLAALASRTTPSKGVLPVLQGFEQEGYPVSSDFLASQLAVYRRIWPNLPSAAVYAWKMSSLDSAPLVEVAGRPILEAGLCTLFRGLSRRSTCRSGPVVHWR